MSNSNCPTESRPARNRRPAVCLDPETLNLLREEAKRRGLNALAKLIGVSRNGLASVLAETAQVGSVRNVLAGLPNLHAALAALPKPHTERDHDHEH